MDAQTIIAKRIALELRDGMLVNLGIGIPTLVANFVPPALQVFFQSENGLIGTGARSRGGHGTPLLTDAGGKPVTALPGRQTFDSAMSFGLIRGGHLDMTVLGGLQVDAHGHLANWMIPGKMVPGMGGAMDLVSGAKRVIVAMQHTAKGKPKIVKQCSLPLTSVRPVDLVVTELAVGAAGARGGRPPGGGGGGGGAKPRKAAEGGRGGGGGGRGGGGGGRGGRRRGRGGRGGRRPGGRGGGEEGSPTGSSSWASGGGGGPGPRPPGAPPRRGEGGPSGRLLEPDHLHHADGLRRHRRIRRRHVAAGAAAHRAARLLPNSGSAAPSGSSPPSACLRRCSTGGSA